MTVASTADKLVADYLKRLDSELRGLPRARRKELIEEISAHIAEAREGRAPDDEPGVREILEGALHLCLDIPKSILLRALLADVVARMGNLRPDVLPEFRERLQSLQQEFPVAEPAQSILSPMLGNAA